MSRSGYSDDLDQWDLIRWRGAVKSAIKGRRGQAFLREMAAALDAMPEKRLIRRALQTPDGEVCAMGAVAEAKHIDVSGLDPTDRKAVADTFGVAPAMAAEIAFENDEDFGYWSSDDLPERRWQRMRDWVAQQLSAKP